MGACLARLSGSRFFRRLDACFPIPDMLNRFFLCGFGWLAFWVWSATNVLAEEGALRLGVVPFNSAAALMKTHQPLRLHLEKALGRPVVLHSSLNHATFLQDAREGRFDVIIISPHLGVICMEEGYVPLARYRAAMEFLLMVKKDRIRRLDDLRGKRIGVPDRMSMFSIGGLKWLQDMDMQPKRDFQLSEWPNHGAVLLAVAQGRLDAGVSARTAFNQMPLDVRDKLTIFSPGPRFFLPHLMTLARAGLGEVEIARVQAAFESFPLTEAGRLFFRQTGYNDYMPVTEQDIQMMRPYVTLTRKLMAQPR
jgi:phosphonate transport system substrate-binding protein